ncbi:resolvase [Methylobacterium terrae]|uniref:Resolvase n=1 Tax=Methylobacterium terrae TaxID=2202827 RepID=A0A2U8WPD1_9HYPH|nr:recombinase family protein [Methylobacterium terrae]AWN47156.1 resolvase [Methylobacterium terrae]
MKVFGYIRVSTSEQASNGESLETQRRQVEAWATLKGWTVAAIHVEAGVSGSVPLAERPEGARLVGRLARGDVVITPKLDRMFRSAADALGTLEEMKALGVALHMIDLGGDVCGNGISKLVFTILSAVAESERDRIRERIRDVKRHLAAQGVYNGGKRPFGWNVVDGRLVANEEEQAVIREMQRMRAENQSYGAIGRAVGKDMKTVARILDRVAS